MNDMRSNTRRNRGANRPRNRGKDRRMGQRQARREKSSAPGGISQLVEIEFDKAVEQILKKTRPVELKTRIRKILDTFEKGTLHTYEQYGYKKYLNAEKGKVTASFGEK